MAGKRMLLSLVLIMRDAEREIGMCLESCGEAVDEMVLVDTGSKDGTVRAARRFLRGWLRPGRRGKIYHYEWQDDFAAARNFALSHAHGEWLLLLDADEYLSRETRGNLRPLVEALAAGRLPEWLGPCFATRAGTEPGELPDMVELTRHNVDLDGNDVPGEKDDISMRLARRSPDFRYQGVVHEQLAFRDGHAATAALAPPERLLVLHTGYRRELQSAHLERNYGLLRSMEARGESFPLADYYLADMHIAKGEWEAAAARAARMLEEGNVPLHDRFAPWRLLYRAWNGAGNEAKVAEVLALGLEFCPDYPDFWYLRGVRLWNAGREQEGLRDLEQAARLQDEFSRRHTDQLNGFLELEQGLREALAVARSEIGEQGDSRP